MGEVGRRRDESWRFEVSTGGETLLPVSSGIHFASATLKKPPVKAKCGAAYHNPYKPHIEFIQTTLL